MKNISNSIIKILFFIKIYNFFKEKHDNLELETKFLNHFGKNYDIIKLYINNSEFFFHYNFGLSEVIIGDKKKVNWGINFLDNDNKNIEKLENKENKENFKYKENKENFKYNENKENIDYKKNIDKVGFYRLAMYTYKNSKILLDFEKENKKEKKFEIRKIIKNNNKWPLKEYGLIGFSPLSNFGKYLRENYKKEISILFIYKFLKKKNIKTNLLNFKSKIIINPEYKKKDIIFEFEISKEKNNWEIQGDFELENINWKFKNKKICVTNFLNEIIIFNDNSYMCDLVKKKVCKNFQKKK